MPAITATVHQALRYFFVGAIAAVFVAVPPGEGWSRRFRPFLASLAAVENPGAVLAVLAVAMLIGGCLIYAAHRVIVYPLLFRFCIILPMLGNETSERGWRRWWPYGKAVSGELYLESLGARLAEHERERFIGWASEIHLGYLATEIALFTLCIWPRSPAVTCSWAWGLGLVLFLVAAWDRQQVSVLVDRARNPVRAAPAAPRERA